MPDVVVTENASGDGDLERGHCEHAAALPLVAYARSRSVLNGKAVQERIMRKDVRWMREGSHGAAIIAVNDCGVGGGVRLGPGRFGPRETAIQAHLRRKGHPLGV